MNHPKVPEATVDLLRGMHIGLSRGVKSCAEKKLMPEVGDRICDKMP